MKKFFAFVIVLALLTIALPHISPAYAAGKEQVDVYEQQKLIKSIVFVIGKDEYFVNGKSPGVKMDAAPFIENDRTYVPVRFMGYALGLTEKDITWEANVKRVTMRGPVTTVEMAVGSEAIVTMPTSKVLDGTLGIRDRNLEIIDVAPVLKAEPAWRTYLPARFVAEALGFEVAWDNGYVVVWPAGEPKPDITPVKEYVEHGVVPPQQPQPPVTTIPQNGETYIANGYTIPKKTDLDIDIAKDSSRADISMCIRLESQSTLEQQYQDAYSIMASKFGENIAKEIVDYAKQKQKRFDDLAGKDWQINGQKVRVGSNGGNYWIQIIAWEAGV